MSTVVPAKQFTQTSARAREISDVQPIDVADIIVENNGSNIAYTDWNRRRRAEVDLSDPHAVPALEDEDGRPIPLYNNAGFLLDRATWIDNEDNCPPGILADLMKMTELFNDYEGCNEDSGVHAAKVYQYAQAFTELGNIQASDPPPGYQARAHHLNTQVSDDAAFGVIRCRNFQGYNLESHRTRTSAKTHIAQNAALTQLFSGTHLQKANNKFNRAATRVRYGQLPHKHLEAIIKGSERDIGAIFRLEVVTEISIQQLREEYRTGGSVGVEFKL